MNQTVRSTDTKAWDAYKAFLESNEYFGVRLLVTGKWAAVCRFMFTDAIITGRFGDHSGYEDRWCFEHGEALPALEAWDGTGEPIGWHRHPDSGRRRWGGDPAKEYVDP